MDAVYRPVTGLKAAALFYFILFYFIYFIKKQQS